MPTAASSADAKETAFTMVTPERVLEMAAKLRSRVEKVHVLLKAVNARGDGLRSLAGSWAGRSGRWHGSCRSALASPRWCVQLGEPGSLGGVLARGKPVLVVDAVVGDDGRRARTWRARGRRQHECRRFREQEGDGSAREGLHIFDASARCGDES